MPASPLRVLVVLAIVGVHGGSCGREDSVELLLLWVLLELKIICWSCTCHASLLPRRREHHQKYSGGSLFAYSEGMTQTEGRDFRLEGCVD